MKVKSATSRKMIDAFLKLSRETLDRFEARVKDRGFLDALTWEGDSALKADVMKSLLGSDRTPESVEERALSMLMTDDFSIPSGTFQLAARRAARDVIAICRSIRQIDASEAE